ncbi:MAG: ATP-binding protein [Pyrinomonadaceae bacterium]
MDVTTRTIEDSPACLLDPSENVRACCTIAREQIEVGNYDAACAVLQLWWTPGNWPILSTLGVNAAGELLLTAGSLSGLIGNARNIEGGQRPAEALLSAAVGLFLQCNKPSRAAEASIELAYCYYREGFFDLARSVLHTVLDDLSFEDNELRTLALLRLAIVERHAGRLLDSRSLLDEAGRHLGHCRELTQGRFHTEYATTLKEIGIAETKRAYLILALEHYEHARRSFERIGNRRYTAAVANNHGYLLLTLDRYQDAQQQLEEARRLFDQLADEVRCAQVDETLAQLYLRSENYGSAERSIKLAVNTLEGSGEDALLAEALTTYGLIQCRLGRRHEAKPILERARRVAERCGDREGAGRALLIMVEEMCEQLADDERREIGAQANQLLANSQQHATRERLRKCVDTIAEAHTRYEAQREQEIHAHKMAALGELSFGVAHNVNNTLTGILGRAQLILRHANDPAKIQSGLDLIIKSAEDGAQIIRRIQDFARQRPSREFETIAITDLLKDACEMTRPRWESLLDSRQIRVALVADTQAMVNGDAVELREVLVNMIYNAVDAMPEGGEIHLSTHETHDRVVIQITDTGTGMGSEVKSRLFDPFFTTKGKKGTGMGLAVSFGIVRRHEGSIDVESEPGHGTTFRISLPKVARTTLFGENSAPVSIESAPGARKLRVLVVDDETPVREVLIDALEAEGCEVCAAQTGESALELYDRYHGQFDAVFTDIGMPEMSGWELVTAIRERSKTVPLAIVSGWADAISVDTRNAIKADWVVAKPFAIDKITAIAQEIASRKSKEIARYSLT